MVSFFVFKYITQYMWLSVLANWANLSPSFYCNSLKFIVITLSSVVVGGGPGPSCSWGGWWGQDQSSKINLEKFQSPLEASEFSTQLFSLLAKVFFYRIWLWWNKCLNVFVTEPWTGGSVHQHAVESGPEPDNCDHVGDVFRLLHYSERQSYSRETQSEFSWFQKYFLVRYTV